MPKRKEDAKKRTSSPNPKANLGRRSPKPTFKGIHNLRSVFASRKIEPRYPPSTTTFPKSRFRGSSGPEEDDEDDSGSGVGEEEKLVAERKLRFRFARFGMETLGREREGVWSVSVGRVGRESRTAWSAVF